jgi:Fe-S-cluster containining protein
MSQKNWWAEGVQFQCQGSGKCCVSHGEFGYVYLTREDRQRMAKVLKLTTREFMAKHCQKENGFWILKAIDNGDCRFLENKKCSVYDGRPTQCRTWPWWPEVMNAKSWSKDVSSFCPGVGKGRVWSEEEITNHLREQKRSEDEL